MLPNIKLFYLCILLCFRSEIFILKCMLNLCNRVLYVFVLLWGFPLRFVCLSDFVFDHEKPFGNVSFDFWFRPMKKVHASTETHEVIILVLALQLFHINQAKTFCCKFFKHLSVKLHSFEILTSALLKIKELNNETLTFHLVRFTFL